MILDHKKIGILFRSLVFLLIFLQIYSGAFALKFVLESNISTENQKEEIIGSMPGGQLGSAMGVGDFDNDGIDDIATGAPFASENENQWNGSVKIIFGAKDNNSKKYELDLFGDKSGDQLGTTVAVGDFNGDNYDDIAIGAYNAQGKGKDRPGKVYIVFGSPGMRSQALTHLNIRQAYFGYGSGITELSGQANSDQFGLSICALDLNNDGIKDLLIGAPLASGSNFGKSGAVYLYLGSKHGINSDPNYTFYAQSENEKFGSSISGGHLNSVQKNSLVVGAYMANDGDRQQVGRVYIIKYNPFATYAKESITRINGKIEKGWFGFSVDVGNLNADKYDDLAVSTFPYKGNRKNARVSIYYGSSKSTKRLADMIVDGPVGEAFLGESVLLEDLNNDGKADILLGAPGIGDGKSEEEGSVYAISSSRESFSNHYTLKEHDFNIVIRGENDDDWFGTSLAVADFNGDGQNDLIVGSRYADGEEAIDNGKVYVLYGGEKFLAKAKLRSIMESTDQRVSRAELISQVIDDLNIKKNKAAMIKNCYDHKDFCFFNFMAMSSYSKIKLKPQLILYPDVSPSDSSYEDINIATMLGLVNGFTNETDTPFHPELSIKRIEALKILLGAADLVQPKYQFELIAELGSYKNLSSQKTPFNDINAKIPSMWWFPRYVNFAVENNIVDKNDFFRPNDDITATELNDMISRTLQYLKEHNSNEKTKS